MSRLSVNVDHVATVRQARLDLEPDPLTAALMAELAGANGITMHLREDRRHIQDRDLAVVSKALKTELNLEMAATEQMLDIALETKPHMVTLVPENRKELTTEGGLDIRADKDRLKGVVSSLQDAGIPVNLFIDPDPESIRQSHRIGAAGVEIHTGSYANATDGKLKERELKRIADAIVLAGKLDMKRHAGHGLDYTNVQAVVALGGIDEFAIGFSIIARSIYTGISEAVRQMKALVSPKA